MLIDDATIDALIGAGSISADQAKRWMRAQRDLHKAAFDYYWDETSRLHKQVNDLTNFDYEERITELENDLFRAEHEALGWREKYQALRESLENILDDASDKRELSA